MFSRNCIVRQMLTIITILLFTGIISASNAIATTKKTHVQHTRVSNKKHRIIKHTNKKITPAKHKKITMHKKIKHAPFKKRISPAKHSHTPATTVVTSNLTHSLMPTYLLTSMEKNLVTFVRNTVESIRYTTYKLGGTQFEPSRGIYVVDCSSYVDYILKTVYPSAYTSLANWSGNQKPTTNDFYQYFRNLSDRSRHWNSIDDAEELRPGDVLVFRSKNRLGIETGGHVMIVMDTPERKGNTLLLRIADAAPSGHSKDTRQPHASGIGIGSMLLKVDPTTSLPYAYAWKVGSRWERNVNFAMARPVGFS